jgi:hypothetical protein
MAHADVFASTISGGGAAPILTPEQRALAQRLGAGDKAEPLRGVAQGQHTRSRGGSAQKAASYRGTFVASRGRRNGVLCGAAPSHCRRAARTTTPNAGRTLMLDISKALTAAKARVEKLHTLELQSASLSIIDTSEAKELLRKVTVVLAEGASGAAGVLATQVSEFLERQRKVCQSTTLRYSDGAQGTGIRGLERLATAAPQDGKVILRRAANPEMGVEVAGMHGGGRVQFRPVRFGPATSSGDSRRDRDIETIWCSDFDHLKSRSDVPKRVAQSGASASRGRGSGALCRCLSRCG